jgi:ADP-heptose:LPS heptosyltransferase/GT2 family glycosyltransferase
MPCGTLYVNEGSVEETFFVEGEPITLKPKQAKFIGGSSNDLVHYLLYPGFWESQKVFDELKSQNKNMSVLIDVSRIDRWGDNLMTTIVPKSFKESYEDHVHVDVLINPALVQAWENNPHIRTILTEKPTMVYDLVVDLNGLELKYQPKDKEKCSNTILKKSGLHTVNKTPVYKVADQEKEWAQSFAAGLSKPIIGVGRESFAQVRTYPHMDRLIELLKEFDGSVVILDEKNADGTYKFTFREMGALINECTWVVANDSGVLHLAGALKKRVVGLFGHTDGKVVCENYEKAIPINATKCPLEKHPCWWEVPCIEGDSYQVKEPLGPPACLQELEPEEVIGQMCDELGKVKKVLVVMLTFDLLQWTKLAVESIRSFHDYDLFVADNESTDGTQAWLKEKGIEFEAKRCGVAAAQNVGFRKFLEGDYDYVVLVNNDVALHYNAIDSLVDMMEKNKDLGGLTATEETKIAPWTIDLCRPIGTGFDIIQDIPTSAYSCTIFSREIVEKIGLFDEHFTPRYIEDNDYTLRLRIAGAKFGKSKEALFYHTVGAVLGSKAEERKYRDVNWNKNINYYIEKWGLHPHEPQKLESLGPEHHQGEFIRKIDEALVKQTTVSVLINRVLGGVGDVIFVSIIGRELKRKYGNKVKIFYHVCAHDSVTNQKEVIKTLPYIDGFDQGGDIILDLTEADFRQEWQEIATYGEITSPRTALHLRIAGLLTNETNLKPDYIVTKEEVEWAEAEWAKYRGGEKRVVICPNGSNNLKRWHGMDAIVLWTRNNLKCRLIVDDPKHTFRQLSALISRAHLVISPDSGPSNVAGALDIPVITLFSNRNGKLFEAMFPSMIALQGHCPLGHHHCDYKVPCAGTEGPYRMKENGVGEPGCFRNLEPPEMLKLIEGVLG